MSSLVLIVEDRAENRYLLRVLLQGNGYDVVEASNGAEALLIAAQSLPALIISDLLMPVMDGYTFLRRCKIDDRLRSVPFIVYTATYTDAKDERLALDLGADAFLQKSTEPSVLMAKVREVLRRSALGQLPPAPASHVNEIVLLEQYSEVLVRKLEEKARLLEESNESLKIEIADHKRARKFLQHTSDLLAAVTNGTTDAVFVKDIEGRYLLCNPAAAQFMGRDIADIIGHNDSEFFDVESAQQIMDNDRAVMIAGAVITHEETLTAAGATRSFLATKGPYHDSEGSLAGIIGISRDITERKKLEQQLNQSQKMEAIGRLAGGVAHDFNNLLSVIIGYTDFALESITEGESLHTDIKQVRLAAEKAAALTNQLLIFSRKQVLKPQVLVINQTIAASKLLLQRLIGEDIEIRFTPDSALGKIKADASQIEQLILNLAVNARDAMPKGGIITMETSNVEVTDSYISTQTTVEPGHYVLLSFTDTGCGMDEETMSRIFEPFFTTKAAGKGTGLGLASVYGIVEQSGGSITVYSEVGLGTTFKVLLPRVDDDFIAQESPVPKAAPKGTETVLLVEDDAALREMTLRVLQRAGYKTLVASNGSEGLTVAESFDGEIHLVLTDVVMPRLSGRDLVEQLSKTRPGIKVLFMSGFTDDSILRYGILQDTIEFLSKPFTAIQFAERVREVLDKPR